MANQFGRSLLRESPVNWYIVRSVNAAEPSFPSQAAGQQIVALANLGNPSFAATNWEISLISFAILGLVILANTVLFRNLPLIEGSIMILHCFAFFAFIVVLAYVLKHHRVGRVFDTSTDRVLQGDGATSKSIRSLHQFPR